MAGAIPIGPGRGGAVPAPGRTMEPSLPLTGVPPDAIIRARRHSWSGSRSRAATIRSSVRCAARRRPAGTPRESDARARPDRRARPGPARRHGDGRRRRADRRHHGGRRARPDPAEAIARRRLRRPVERCGRHGPVCRGATAGRRALRAGHPGPRPGGRRGRCPAPRPAELRRARGRGGHGGLASGSARRARRQGRGAGRLPVGGRGGDQFRPARSRRARLADRDQPDQHRSPRGEDDGRPRARRGERDRRRPSSASGSRPTRPGSRPPTPTRPVSPPARPSPSATSAAAEDPASFLVPPVAVPAGMPRLDEDEMLGQALDAGGEPRDLPAPARRPAGDDQPGRGARGRRTPTPSGAGSSS